MRSPDRRVGLIARLLSRPMARITLRHAVALSGPAVAASLVLLFAAARADAARIVTWSDPAVSTSRFVDPSAAPAFSYNEPPGVDERPNALKVNVYFPKAYGKHPKRRWPVLYLLHGNGDAYDSWAHPEQGDLLRTARGLEAIVVMPEADRGFYADHWNGGERGAPAWERYHLQQLMRIVSERLRIKRGRRWHAIAGLSMGGEGAMYYASQRPGYFGSAAAFSATLSIRRITFQQAFPLGTNGGSAEAIFGNPVAQEFYWRGHDPLALVGNLASTRLFVSSGNGIPTAGELDNPLGALLELEVSQHAAEFVPAAEAAGAPVTYTPHPGIHAWPYWRADLAAAIAWDPFAEPPEPDNRWTFSTVSQRGGAWGVAFRFDEEPATVQTLIRDGDVLRGDGSGSVALRPHKGCRVHTELPFELDLADVCRR